MLDELGFPSLFVDWIMECVKSVSYSILINGMPTTSSKRVKARRKELINAGLIDTGAKELSR